MDQHQLRVKNTTEKHPNKQDKPFQYGTAGFRTKATLLDSTMYRMGLLAVLRSKAKLGAAVGAMITASHNPEPDNGIKLVDPHGEMLESVWERVATELANVSDAELWNKLASIVESENIDWEHSALVVVGRDTRPSSSALSAAVLDGIAALGGQVRNLGVVSTPLVHYIVHGTNTLSPGHEPPSEESYYVTLTTAFRKLRPNPSNGNYKPFIKFDGANGVGAIAMRKFIHHLGDSLSVEMYNENGPLNHECGADHVKVCQSPPCHMPLTPLARCVSVDGDADRIIYFYMDTAQEFHMLDGDRIATLLAGYLQELLVACPGCSNLKLGLVQTAYANGNSTRYITEQLNVPVACVSTGVKHLHHRAVQFDIGVYFEANGHGTVVFSDNAQKQIRDTARRTHSSLPTAAASTEAAAAARALCGLMDVTNQTVGDAVSDLLLVETVLHARGWSVQDWAAAYTDLPNRQLKVSVQDRTVVTTSDAERRCVTPTGLQTSIDSLVAQVTRGRAFVRPSGTEDVVRVYAEAETRELADQLAQQVAAAVEKFT